MPEPRSQSPAAVARRAKRRQAKRDIVVRATLDIINEGDINPTMPKIADRSGIPERSIFRYFGDIADLTTSVVALARSELSVAPTIDPLGTGPLDERIDAFVSSRLTQLDRVWFVGQVARRRTAIAPAIGDTLDAVVNESREEITAHFAPELTTMSADEADAIVRTITTLTSFEGYFVQRHRLSASVEEISASWTSGLHRLLT